MSLPVLADCSGVRGMFLPRASRKRCVRTMRSMPARCQNASVSILKSPTRLPAASAAPQPVLKLHVGEKIDPGVREYPVGHREVGFFREGDAPASRHVPVFLLAFPSGRRERGRQAQKHGAQNRGPRARRRRFIHLFLPSDRRGIFFLGEKGAETDMMK